tara:strand:+ start:271 stop:552 length:282 start_codon:yes stop_codon:yes gene_type:complete
MAKDRFGYGNEEKSWAGKLLGGQQIPFSENLMKKTLGEDETTYFQLREEIGEDNIKKLTDTFVNEYVSKDPKLTLADLNKFIISILKDSMGER